MPKKSFNNNKLRNKIEKLISKYDRKNSKQEKELEIGKSCQTQLENLLKRVPKEAKESNKELNQEFKNITKKHREEMKSFKKELKLEKHKFKQERKERKSKSKEERKNSKNERKEKKAKFVQDLANSRCEELPELKENGLESLDIIVDGWNITGCDKIARKCMRGKRGSGAKRIVFLLHEFGEKSSYCKSNNINLTVHFDGNGKDETSEMNGVKVVKKYSGSSEIVDDRLVREFGENVKNVELEIGTKAPFTIESNPNRNYLVITSDRELTLRLNKIGVSCMKSGCFYKKYLKKFAFSGLEEFEETESKENEERSYKSKSSKSSKSKGKPRKYKGKRGKHKSKKHWKKYIKNRFSDNSTSSKSSDSSSSSSSSSSGEDETMVIIENKD